MKRMIVYLLSLSFCANAHYKAQAQNPKWTMPGGQYQAAGNNYLPLPNQPLDPMGNPVTDDYTAYQGEPAEYSSASYSDPDGNILLFTVDESVYDKNGWVVGKMRTQSGTQTIYERQGYSEVLILPLGNSCTKFAIIFTSSATNLNGPGQYSTSAHQRVYMAVYDMEAQNNYNDYDLVVGALEGEGIYGFDITLQDITKEYYVNHYNPNLSLYQLDYLGDQGVYQKGYQIAATELIDNCYRYLLVCDGTHIIRYKLTENGLEYDNYSFEAGPTGSTPAIRTEMELIKLANNNYRLAVPMSDGDLSATFPEQLIRIFDLNSNMQLVPGSEQTIDLVDGAGQKAEPNGLEFDATGRYLYFTHLPNADLPNVINVWDVQSNAMASATFPTSISAFEQSYIERSGSDLYLAKSDKIGQILNASTPSSPNFAFDPNYQTITSGYGNDANIGSSKFRYQFPDQVEDGLYGNVGSYSCECCRRWAPASVDRFVATTSATWTPTTNPFGNVADVYITDELVINPGVDIFISGMNFYFGPNARVLVRRQQTNETGAYLNLMGGTVFTADNRCGDQTIDRCGIADECERELWQGIVVEGFTTNITQSFTSITPHGRLRVVENSMIEYAQIGARAGNPQLPESNGGMIQMFEARVKDCVDGVWFDTYSRLTSGGAELFTSSNISYTSFRTTTDWIDGNIPRAFVTVSRLSGIYLSSNSYVNEDFANFAVADRGIGIKILRSRVVSQWSCGILTPNPCPPSEIDRSEFRNLYYGVCGANSGLVTRTFYDYHSRFINNRYGIYLSNFVNPEILDSNFEVPQISNSVGIYLDGSTGYRVENNSLTTFGGVLNTRNIGIIVSNS